MSPIADAAYLLSPDLGVEEEDPLLEKRSAQTAYLRDGEEGNVRDWETRPAHRSVRQRRLALASALALLAALVLAVLLFSTRALPMGIFAGPAKSPPSPQYKYVAFWRSPPLEADGWVRKPVALPQAILERENKTDINSVFRSVIATPHSNPAYIAIRVVAQFWAYPFDRFEGIHHRGPALFDDRKHNNFTLRLEVYNGSHSANPLQARLHYYDWKFVEFLVPAQDLQLSTVERDNRRFPVRFSLEWEGETAVFYEAELEQSWTPYSRQAICTRPLFGGMSPLDYKEWRLHHGAMGFDIVHWGSRDAEMAQDLEQLNRLTGYQDTFTYFPRFEERAENDFWEEHFTNNDCYSTYSHAAEFMGVWDHDEFFSPTRNDSAWTREFVSDYLDELDPKVTAVNLPWWWINKSDFGAVPEEVLLEAQPDLDEQALQDIAKLQQNGNGLKTQPDGGMFFTTKSIYRTNVTASAKVHHGSPCCGQSQRSGVDFAVYHVRRKANIWKGAFTPNIVSPGMVSFWRDLGARLRRMEEPQ